VKNRWNSSITRLTLTGKLHNNKLIRDGVMESILEDLIDKEHEQWSVRRRTGVRNSAGSGPPPAVVKNKRSYKTTLAEERRQPARKKPKYTPAVKASKTAKSKALPSSVENGEAVVGSGTATCDFVAAAVNVPPPSSFALMTHEPGLAPTGSMNMTVGICSSMQLGTPVCSPASRNQISPALTQTEVSGAQQDPVEFFSDLMGARDECLLASSIKMPKQSSCFEESVDAFFTAAAALAAELSPEEKRFTEEVSRLMTSVDPFEAISLAFNAKNVSKRSKSASTFSAQPSSDDAFPQLEMESNPLDDIPNELLSYDDPMAAVAHGTTFNDMVFNPQMHFTATSFGTSSLMSPSSFSTLDFGTVPSI
jgi:hypothetical protein